MQNLETVLKQTFGLESFREGQKEVCESVIAGKDTLVFMPTGGGKSLTYQLPGVVLDGLTIVISPLISLMKDQVDKLVETGIKACLINSTISSQEIKEILADLESASLNPIKFLYIAPERLNSSIFLNVLKRVKISLMAIDEAHCISQWGHDFRPSYMKIHSFIEDLKAVGNNFPIIALTATATQKVREDIVERLGITDYNTFIKGFDRKNIAIIVREISEKKKKMEKTLEILDKTPGSGIIYCSSRKTVKEVYDTLLDYNVKAGIYTGEMLPDDREIMQNRFMNDDIKVIVATNAFGMGIDKKDIRFIIHYNLPGSIENYYQEVGRAGRDGKNSFAVVLASYGDTKIQEYFIESTYPSKQEILDFYDYLYKNIKIGEGIGTTIAKTYHTMSNDTGLANDMKVGSIIKILEKYGIIRRGMNQEKHENFRGVGITLIKEKRPHSHLLIDWKRQELLKDEAYFKLEQIKKLLFYPHCRKKFILEYFGDKEDAKALGENCHSCDFCLDKKKFEQSETKDIIPISSFSLVLETIKDFPEKFGAALISRMLVGSRDKRISEWKLNDYRHYGALCDYERTTVGAIIDALIFEEYIYKTSGKFPTVGITEIGEAVIIRDKPLRESLEDLNRFVVGKVGFKVHKKTRSKAKTGNISPRGETKKETLDLFKKGETLDSIAQKRELQLQTIENHIVDLYASGDLSLIDIMKLISLSNIKEVKSVINDDFSGEVEKLKPIKEKLQENGFKIPYFEIKLAIAMMEKGDI